MAEPARPVVERPTPSPIKSLGTAPKRGTATVVCRGRGISALWAGPHTPLSCRLESRPSVTLATAHVSARGGVALIRAGGSRAARRGVEVRIGGRRQRILVLILDLPSYLLVDRRVVIERCAVGERGARADVLPAARGSQTVFAARCCPVGLPLVAAVPACRVWVELRV